MARLRALSSLSADVGTSMLGRPYGEPRAIPVSRETAGVRGLSNSRLLLRDAMVSVAVPCNIGTSTRRVTIGPILVLSVSSRWVTRARLEARRPRVVTRLLDPPRCQ